MFYHVVRAHARLGLLALGLLLCAGMSVAQNAVNMTFDMQKVFSDALQLIDPATAQPATLQLPPNSMISFMGDSITQQAGYVRLVTYTLKTNYPNLNCTINNAGISGQQAEHMEPRFEKDMKLAEHPAYAFINVGINDVWHRDRLPHDPAVLEAYKANVTKMVEKAQAAGAKPVLLTPTVIQENPTNEDNTRLVMYVDAMKAIAAEKGCALIDLHAYFLSALARKPAGLALTADGVHMGIYGDALMATGVLRALGMSDAAIAATNTQPALQMRGWGLSLDKTAELLQIPASRFGQQALVSKLSF